MKIDFINENGRYMDIFKGCIVEMQRLCKFHSRHSISGHSECNEEDCECYTICQCITEYDDPQKWDVEDLED